MISDLPGLLTTGTKHIPLSRGRISAVAVARIGFPTWNGIAPTSTWGRKPVIGPTDVPFAELAIAAHLRQRGWASGWVYRQLRFLESWEPRRHAVLPPESLDLFGKISRAAQEAVVVG